MEYFTKRKSVFGLFLTSGVVVNADYTMERINAVARYLRQRQNFKGYIHLKIIPGASDASIEEALSLATAVSLNIETPGKRHFEALSNKKNYEHDILQPIKLMGKLTGKGMKHERVKCTTQFIVGASDETDGEIVQSMSSLYNGLNFKRIYFSVYQKGLGSPDIPGERQFLSNPEERFMREHRLYQVDFLMRRYGFKGEDIPLDNSGNLRLDKDPKEVWAESHPEFFPLMINKADKEALLRVPGLGPDTVKWVLKTRKESKFHCLEELGVKGRKLQRMRKYLVFE